MKRLPPLPAAAATLAFALSVSCQTRTDGSGSEEAEIPSDSLRTLVVVDVQRDFFDPSGALYVCGSETLPEKIAAVANAYDIVVFTLDWHPADHCSFKDQGGSWPSHCVAYTQGAGLPDCFASILARGPEHVFLYLKGKDSSKEEYGAFDKMDAALADRFACSTRIDICGIAGDYCVKESTANLLKSIPARKVTMLTDCIRSIDDGSTLDAFIADKGLATYSVSSPIAVR